MTPEVDVPSNRIGPSPLPAREIEVTVQCRTHRDQPSRARHLITIHPDWSISTPHDLEAERIAAALGGYLSCLHLADSVIPAARAGLMRQARISSPLVWLARATTTKTRAGWAVLDPIEGCCDRSGFQTVRGASAHTRSLGHLCHEFGVPRWQLKPVLGAILKAHSDAQFGEGKSDPCDWPLAPSTESASDVTCERHGAAALWLAGLHPETVAAIHRQLGASTPLPARTILSVAMCSPNVAWMRATLAALGPSLGEYEPETPRFSDANEILHADTISGEISSGSNLALWLAATYEPRDKQEPSLRAQWLASGIPRRIIPILWRANYTLTGLASLATAMNASTPSAALKVSHWIEKGWCPPIGDLTLLTRIGSQSVEAPSAHEVQRLSRELSAGIRLTVLAVWLSAFPPVNLAVKEFRSLPAEFQNEAGLRIHLSAMAG